ncbi:MAG: homoserine dehydrogenase [Candidatus Bathyarchaeia archaeon]
MRIIIIGYGSVARAFARLIAERAGFLTRTQGLHLRVVAVVDRGGAAINPRGLDIEASEASKKLHGTVAAHPDWGRPSLGALDVIEKIEAELVVEATPTNIKDGEPGLSHIYAALKKPFHVVTVNKGPLALAMPALNELAAFNKVQLRFSGTVGGGTPILDFAKRCLQGDRITGFRGILNGTTNYILSRMDAEGVSFEEALSEAQRAGFAEADPSMDIDGWDSACKLVITANHVLGRRVTLRDVKVEGIRGVTPDSLAQAKKRGCAVKLIASADGALEVRPTEVSRLDPICVSGSLNAVTFTTEDAGEETIIGRGAGGRETASAILRDIIDISRSVKGRG